MSVLLADLCYADHEDDAVACYPLMRQLRPHIATPEDFVACWRRQVGAGYRMLTAWHERRPVAIAGFRVQENLVYGPFFYVDDLVTDEALRGGGYGAQLMDRLKAEALALGCDRLVLDTPLTNVLGHRFYYRHGLVARALRFSIALA